MDLVEMLRPKTMRWIIFSLFLSLLSCQNEVDSEQSELTAEEQNSPYEYALWRAETGKLAHLDQIRGIYELAKREHRALTGAEIRRITNHASWVRYNAELIQAMNLPRELQIQNQRGMIDLSAAVIDNQGRIIGNGGKVIANYKAAADVENARIKNFGEQLENVGKHLDNVDQALDNNLKTLYTNAYGHYVSAYQRYVRALYEISRQKRHMRNKLMRSIKDMNRYYKQHNKCMRQAENLLAHEERQGYQESNDGKVSLRNIQLLYRGARAELNGEECVERVLLKMSNKDTSYLNNIVLKVDNVNGEKLQQICGLSDSRPKDAFEAAEIASRFGYPGVRINTESFLPRAFDKPFTHYQLYKLLMSNDMRIRLGAPPADDVPQHEHPACAQRNPKVQNYLTVAKLLEAEKYKQWDEFRQDGEAPFNLGKANYEFYQPEFEKDSRYQRNKSYYSLMRDFQTIFAHVKGCVDTQKENESFTPSTAAAANTAGVTQSFLANFHNPIYPEQSEAIRMCVGVSEEYRHRASQNNTSIAAVLRTFEEVAQETVPKAPHPAFPTYNPTPNVPAGNQ